MRKSDRLKRLESSLADLVQWLELGLVPKNDLKKHQAEIDQHNEHIAEEKERLRMLSEEGVEFTMLKRGTNRSFQDSASISDVGLGDETLAGFEGDDRGSDRTTTDTTQYGSDDTSQFGKDEVTDIFSSSQRGWEGVKGEDDYYDDD